MFFSLFIYTFIPNKKKQKMAKKEKTTKLSYKEELSIQFAEDIHTEMQKNFKENKKIEVSVSDTNNIDLTFIQLLYSLKKSASDSEKTVLFHFQMDKESEQLLANAGLTIKLF